MAGSIVESSTNGASTLFFILNFLMSSSLSLLWGLINSQQIVVHTAMFSGLKFPANALAVIEFMISLATFDLIPTDALDDEIYYWPETDTAFSINFEMTGVESKLFLSNVGFALYLIYFNIFLTLVHLSFYKLRNLSRFT